MRNDLVMKFVFYDLFYNCCR